MVPPSGYSGRPCEPEGIEYCGSGDPGELAALYCETRIRRIVPRPRQVHFSDEIHSSLGRLARETDVDKRDEALEAWRTIFTLRHRLVNGEEVTRFLSKGVARARSQDGMLWDFGMHHFHLCRRLDDFGTFVERSDYLLFAIIADDAAYFVDVRRHHDPEGLGWGSARPPAHRPRQLAGAGRTPRASGRDGR